MSKTIHRKKLFGGRYTAQEVHQQYAFPMNAKCPCGARPLIRAIVMAELSEMKKINPLFDEALNAVVQLSPEMVTNNLVQIKGSDGRPTPYIRVGIAYSCARCRPTMEKALAKTPSHFIVEINRGPTPDKTVTGYGS
jgi:hypothetical protein